MAQASRAVPTELQELCERFEFGGGHAKPLTESLSARGRCGGTTAAELFLAVNRSNPTVSAFRSCR
jgi:hypothetical protein